MKEYKILKIAFAVLAPLYLFLICCLPLLPPAFIFVSAPNLILKAFVIIISPVVYGFLYLVIAGLLSTLHRKAVVAGRFPRKVSNLIYFHRRLYGLCWTSVYYFVPVFFLALSVSGLKRMTFRLFGYRGNLNFTTYPDTWIRDLALLELGNGAYLSNKSTIGTNIAMSDGSILVDAVKIEDGALVGHLAMIAPGVVVKKGAEIGVGVGVGIRTIVGENAKINPCCLIEHGVEIGARTKVGAMTYIGSGARIASDLVIPAGITIPPKTKISCQEEVAFYSAHLNQARINKQQWIQQSFDIPVEHSVANN